MAPNTTATDDPAPARRVLILGVAPVQLLDIAGPAEVLAQAGRQLARDGARGEPPYAVSTIIVPGQGLAATSAGLDLPSTASEAQVLGWDAIDTLIVAGGEGARSRADDPSVQRLLRRLAPRARRIASVCTGAFILAAGGLLDGRRVTTHWRWCAELARRHPALTVDPEPIFIRDGTLWTSAGVTAGMDLLLALVEEDHGHALALAVARELVLFLRRPGDQKQFSTVLSAQTGPSARLGGLLAWIAENLHRPLPVEVLAARACLSPRQFARVFREETGMTPARLVEQLRVEAARQRLESGRAGLAAVVAACGFGTEETMRRAFLRQVGASPGDYRDRFRHAAPARIPPMPLRDQHP
ncbi:GlxA family transcriptional regulator [Plastoroseomonas hellenica]|uniref:GlxA family transcriptional regulator n=1 Tax=Plastoroseomonas hellenica TaxID=2687306 RepID=UPI001BABF386|nr:helix-turn-helix domain-containing protein [Plastoroseomonas hellenica]MBR0647393.1 helix-turn-helix domain-containing protein [Plastoroseomonas hellenica]